MRISTWQINMADGLRLGIADESNALFQGMIVTFRLIPRIL